MDLRSLRAALAGVRFELDQMLRCQNLPDYFSTRLVRAREDVRAGQIMVEQGLVDEPD